MPVVPYVNRIEPSEDAVIWRFMDLRKFRDLIASEELYFRRADLFSDKSEGLPPEEFAMRVLGLEPFDINDRVRLNDHLGFLAQNRESYYISCSLAADNALRKLIERDYPGLLAKHGGMRR